MIENVVERLESILSRVYGQCNDLTLWKPKPFQDNKSRYLWTDAYGVVNFLNLFSLTKNETYLTRALTLIKTVHNTLGRSRDGKLWLANASDDHPTLGGLRIGKPNAEGQGMDQDGQYYHYLTKWMFALNRTTKITNDPKYNRWAIELATAVHPHFIKTRDDGSPDKMFWKISIDLSRPFVSSEGGLDPYDGYVTYNLLKNDSDDSSTLKSEINDMAKLIESRYTSYHTNDTLDAGEALWLCSWCPNELWSKHVCQIAKCAVNKFKSVGEFSGSSRCRLAFREFGTTIGTQMYADMMNNDGWSEMNSKLHDFWYSHLYERDEDITPVMYCASLYPGLLNPKFQI